MLCTLPTECELQDLEEQLANDADAVAGTDDTYDTGDVAVPAHVATADEAGHKEGSAAQPVPSETLL